MEDIDPLKINDELEQFVVIVKKTKKTSKQSCFSNLHTIYRKQPLEGHPNLSTALRVLLTGIISVAGAE